MFIGFCSFSHVTFNLSFEAENEFGADQFYDNHFLFMGRAWTGFWNESWKAQCFTWIVVLSSRSNGFLEKIDNFYFTLMAISSFVQNRLRRVRLVPILFNLIICMTLALFNINTYKCRCFIQNSHQNSEFSL